MEKMHFTRMDEGTDADFQVLKHVHEQTLRALPDRLFGLLGDLRKDTAYNITRYDHCLQTATRALRCGATIRMRIARQSG
jgi:predicted HD phosphohydrolase